MTPLPSARAVVPAPARTSLLKSAKTSPSQVILAPLAAIAEGPETSILIALTRCGASAIAIFRASPLAGTSST
jgi:hypothetical protein